MRRRGLTRIVALCTLVSMLSCEFSAYATTDVPDEGTKVEQDATNDDADNVADATNDGEDNTDNTSKSKYVNELTEKNYTVVSSKYKFPEYKGDTIEFLVEDAYLAEESEGALTDDNFEYKNKAVLLDLGESAKFKINVPKDGVYVFGYDFIASNEKSVLVPEITLKLNGEIPFYECNRILHDSLWKDDSEIRTDRYDNQIVSLPNKVMEWQKQYIIDAAFRYSYPLKLELSAGENIIELSLTEGTLMIGNFYLEEEEEVADYKTGNVAEGKELITIQGEKPYTRNDSSIRATCEFDCDLYPYNSKNRVLNILEGASFNDAGMTVTYEINVEKSGYYYFGFNYRQSDRVDYPVFMNIEIDGKVPNKELLSYAFPYTKSFKNLTLEGSDGEKMAIYLEEGTHYLSTTIAIDNIRQTLQVVDKVMSEVNDLSLEITKVAGTNKDKYRDIEIKAYIPDIEQRLDGWIKTLKSEYERLTQFTEEDGSIGALSSLNLAITKLESLAEDPNDIPYRVKELSTNTSSVSQFLANFITDIQKNNTSFDRIYVYQEDATLPGKSNIFVKIWEAIKRFIASFGAQSYSADNSDPTKLQVWLNRPRQYIEIIQRMVDNYFTPQTGIEVEFCIMPDAQKLILSNAAGESPDVAQAIDYAQPFELAIRNALVDLTQFEDYKEVLSQFSPGLLVPSTIDDSIYSIPETFYFWVLFYRTDILSKLGLEIPDTMQDVLDMLPELKNRGLDFYYPTAGTVGVRTFAMTTPLLYQNGATLYGTNAGNTAINSDAGVAGFEMLTDLFAIYDIPQEVGNFYQHFRNGDIPIGISDYFAYSMLINAAPEIENMWAISLVPGIEDENGVVQRQTAGAAQSSVIMKPSKDAVDIVLTDGTTMKREDASWEYLKWWMSTETQVEFGVTLQTTYGAEYIWNSANTEAFEQLPWKSRDKQTILEQMEWITESPRIPGTYLLERELSNAYVSVVVTGNALRTSLDAAVKRIDRETKRKLQEFNIIDENGNELKEYKVPTVDTVKEILGIED